MNIRGTCALAFAIAALFGAMCSDTGTPVSGPTEEQGNPQIVAVVVDDLHRPISTATVTVYQVPANTDSINQPSAAVLVGLSHTDSVGKCAFENLAPGIYSLKAVDTDSMKSTIKTNIMIFLSKPLQPEYSDTLILTSPGGFHGIVARAVPVTNQQLHEAFIQIKIGEIDRSKTTGPDGKYSFLNLPAGSYTVYYYTDGFYSAKKENIIVRSGGDTAIDSVILKPRVLPPPTGFEAVYDTAAGIVRFHWGKVDFDGLWHYIVQRECLSKTSLNANFSVFDTTLSDTLGAIPSGTTLYYVVRSVDKALNPSVNAGPIEIMVAKKD